MAQPGKSVSNAPTAPTSSSPAPVSAAKLSYKEQRELDALPARIDALEQEQTALRAELADGTLYGQDPQRASTLCQRDVAIDDALMQALERWELLSSRQPAGK